MGHKHAKTVQRTHTLYELNVQRTIFGAWRSGTIYFQIRHIVSELYYVRTNLLKHFVSEYYYARRNALRTTTHLKLLCVTNPLLENILDSQIRWLKQNHLVEK